MTRPKTDADLPPGITLLPSGKFRVKYRDAARKQRSKSFDKRREAERWMVTQKAAVLKGTHVEQVGKTPTFEQYARAEYLTSPSFGPSTRETLEGRFRVHVFPVLGKAKLGSIETSHINYWLRSLTHLAPSYQREILRNVSSVFHRAMSDRLVWGNPCLSKSVKTAPRPERKAKAWEWADVIAIEKNLPDRYAPLATLAAMTGLRQGELFGLSVDDLSSWETDGVLSIDRQVKVFEGNRLVFDLPKRGKTRSVPLPTPARLLLAAHRAQFPPADVALPWGTVDGPKVTHRLLFTSREAGALNRNYINGIWKTALRGAGLPTTRDDMMHKMRHTYASTLLSRGLSLRDLADYLGHSDPAFTLRVYSHMQARSDGQVRQAFADVLDEVGSTEAARGPRQAL